MTTERARYDIHLNTAATGVIHAADCVIEEDAGRVRQVAFRYRDDYLRHPSAFALDPERLPLATGEVVLPCAAGGQPAFIDDHLPDRWGRRVLAGLAFHQGRRQFNADSAMETLAMMGGSRIGALYFSSRGEAPRFDVGLPLTALAQAERTALAVDMGMSGATQDINAWRRGRSLQTGNADAPLGAQALAHLANAGSSVGGARPKVLVSDGNEHCLAKFNRLTGDPYNHARVELACLLMARAAGIKAAQGRVAPSIGGREALLVRRFDIAPDGSRSHLLSVNGLLKEAGTERDSGLLFRYDDIAQLLRRHSADVETDLAQLLRLALFNRCINNTDDHSRNFSLIHAAPVGEDAHPRLQGYRLSPAYDLVPSPAVGEYHAAGFGYDPWPPSPVKARRMGQVFGLGKLQVRQCADEVEAAVARWSEFAAQAGVGRADREMMGRCLRL